MIKVLIVDDETIARINLRHLINWEKEGFVICGEADNGFDALKKVEELKPDIVFTDMNMGGMNGVEFIKNARITSPSIRIIAFSVFDDFEYVRQSLKEGALDYLLKYKIDTHALLSTLTSIKESLKKESMEKQKINRMMEMVSSGKVLIQKNVLINLLNGYIQDNFKAIMKEYEIDLEDRNLVVATARIDDFYRIREKFDAQEFAVFLETIENIITNICSEMGRTVYVTSEDGKFVFIMSFAGTAGEANIYSRAASNMASIEGAIKRFLNITMSFGISSICPVIGKLTEYYNEARTVLENGYYKGKNYIMQKNELLNQHEFQGSAGLSTAMEKNIISSVRSLKRESMLEMLDKIFAELKEKKASFDSIKMASIDLINILEKLIKEYGIHSDRVYSNRAGLYEEIKKFGTTEELSSWFKTLYDSLMDVFVETRIGNRYSPVVKKTMDYILKNFDKDISLSSVSEQVKVSPQYLSRIFKEECGKGFVSYLNHVRIHQAKQMLEDGIELKDLAQKSGFNTYTYFFTVFKEITGVTPQQYEKTLNYEKE